jgi:Fe-S oxidoreductase
VDVAEKLKRDQKLEELKKKNQEEYRKVRAALQLVCVDVNAQIVLRHIAKLSGFFKSSVVVNLATGEVSLGSTTYNEGRRSLYLDLRRMMTDEARRLIESKGEESHDS